MWIGARSLAILLEASGRDREGLLNGVLSISSQRAGTENVPVITDGRDKIKKGVRRRESILLTVSDRPRRDVFFSLELKRGKLKKSKHNRGVVQETT